MYKAYFGERPGDDSGMRTAIWGPGGWLFLHSIAQNYPWNPTQQQMEDYYNFFRLTGNVLPCRYCRESYQQFITQKGTRLTLQTMKNRKSVVIWLYRIHNKVNKKLGVKDHPTLKEVWDKYESFRSVCHKTKQKKVKGCTVPLNGIRKKCIINFVDEPDLILKNKNKNKNKNKVKLKTSLMYNHFGKKRFKKNELDTDDQEEQEENEFGKKTKPSKPSAPPPPDEGDEAPPPENVFTNETLSNAMDMLSVTDPHDLKQIKKQYRIYSLMYHPDKPNGDEFMFKEVNNAYQLLMAYNRRTRFGKIIDYKTNGEAIYANKKVKIPKTIMKAKSIKDLSKYTISQLHAFCVKYAGYICGKKNRKSCLKNRAWKYLSKKRTRFGKKVNSAKRNIKLISIKRSTKSGKKLMATFETNGRKKVIHFGQASASDYTKHSDRTRRNRYIFRHLKDYRTGDPSRAGFLSMFVLWNKPSLQASIADYKRRLNVYNRTGKFPTNISGYKKGF